MAANLSTAGLSSADVSPSSFPRNPPTGIKVIIVGAGYAGLTAAIECDRKGHTPIVLESFPSLKILGDIISFGANSGKIFERWPGVPEALKPICHDSEGLLYKSYEDGEDLLFQRWSEEVQYGTHYNGHRGEIHEIVFKHAIARGIEVRLGAKVVDYFESEEEAGVVLEDGSKVVGDVVLAADGVRSNGRKLVLGYEDKPKSSGYAIYRAWFPSDELAKNPTTAWMVNNGDKHIGWMGPDTHFLAVSIKGGKDFCWVCTHKDDADIKESWQTPGKTEDALEVVKGWEECVQEIIKATPADRLVDWKLVYRDPLPTWVSPLARTVLIGDAAHPFLPTSIQGASQAMEDGANIAVCLEKAGKGNVQEAVKTHMKIRYDRVLKTQQTGVATRNQWHKADFDNVKKNPSVLRLKRQGWILGHDAEEHAYKVYDAVAKEVREGADLRTMPLIDQQAPEGQAPPAQATKILEVVEQPSAVSAA